MEKDQDIRSGGERSNRELIDIRIRAATAEDIDSVRECVRAAFAPYTESIGQEPAPMLADFDADIGNGRVLVAELAGNRVVGLVTAGLTGMKELEIDILAVLPEWQGGGIARALMQSCETKAKQEGAIAAVLYTNEAMERALWFYRRIGYLETARAVEDGYRRVYFKKAL